MLVLLGENWFCLNKFRTSISLISFLINNSSNRDNSLLLSLLLPLNCYNFCLSNMLVFELCIDLLFEVHFLQSCFDSTVLSNPYFSVPVIQVPVDLRLIEYMLLRMRIMNGCRRCWWYRSLPSQRNKLKNTTRNVYIGRKNCPIQAICTHIYR